MKKPVLLAAAAALLFGLEVGEVPKRVVLEGDAGGRVDGAPFDTADLRGKTWLFIYADPDKKDLNEEVIEAIKKRRYPRDRYGSVAVVNMAATWKPNFVISAILKKKQKRYPDTIYVKDKKRVFVQEWGLADDDFNIVVLGPDGRVLFVKSGELSKEDAKRLLKILDEAVGE
jgi:predicted transcriptional regulator